MSELIRLVRELSDEERRRLAPTIVQLAASVLANRGLVLDAYNVVDAAVRAGYDAKLREVRDELKRYVDAYNAFMRLASYLELIKRDLYYLDIRSVDEETVRKIEDTIREVENYIRQGVISGEWASRARRLIDIVKPLLPLALYLRHHNVKEVLKESSDVINKVVKLINDRIAELQGAGGIEGVEKAFRDIASIAYNVRDDLQRVSKKLAEIAHGLRSLPRCEARDKILELVESVKALADALDQLVLKLNHVMLPLSEFIDLLKDYGKDKNFLVNRTYRDNLLRMLTDTLKSIKELEEGIKVPQNVLPSIRQQIEKLDEFCKTLASSLRKYLHKMKADLVKGDTRFLHLFEEAESKAGVSLGSVEVPEHPIERAISEWVRDVIESNMMLFRSEELWKKVLGAIGLIGSAVIDAVTLVARPHEFIDQLKQLMHMVASFYEDVQRRGVEAVREGIVNTINAMFGTPESALMSVGYVLAGILATKVAEKIPLPAYARAVLEDIISGDIPGISLVLMKAPRIVEEIRARIELKDIGKAITEADAKRLLEAISPSLPEALKARIAKEAHIAEHMLLQTIRSARSVEDVAKALREMFAKYGAEELDAFVKRYLNVLKRYDEIMERRLYLKELERMLKPPVSLRDVATRFETLRMKLKQIEDAMRLLSDIEMFLEDLYKAVKAPGIEKLISEVSSARRLLNELKIDKAMAIIERLKGVLESEKNFLKMKSRVVEILKQIGMEKEASAIESARSVGEFIDALNKAIAEISKSIDAAHILAIDRLYRVMETIARDPLLAPLFKVLATGLEEGFAVRVRDAIVIPKNEDLARLLDDIAKKANAPDLHALAAKARSVGLTVRDIELLRDILRKVHPSLELLPDLVELKAMIDKVWSKLEEVSGRVVAPFLQRTIKVIGDELAEMRKILSDEIAGLEAIKAWLIRDAIPSLRNVLTKLVEELKVVEPARAAKLGRMVDEFLAKLSRGIVDMELAKSILRELSELRYLHSSAKEMLTKLIEMVRRGRPGYKVTEFLRRWIDELYDMLKKVPVVPDEYVAIFARELREKFIPMFVPRHMLDKVLEALKSKEYVIEIDGYKAKVSRRVELLPGEMRVVYRIEFPTGNWIEYRIVTRAERPGEVRVFEAVEYDPKLREHPELVAFINREVLDRIDPEFELLRRIAVLRRGELVPLGSLIKGLARAILPIILALRPRTPREILWWVALAIDKRDLFEELRRLAVRVPHDIELILRRYGFEPIAYVPMKPIPIVIVHPTNVDVDRLAKWVKLRINNVEIIVPVMTIKGIDVALLPDIDLELAVPPEELLKQVHIEIPEVPESPPPTARPRGAGPTAPPPRMGVPSLPLYVAGATSSGYQVEKLLI